jgi:hypothetical protein
MMTRELERKKLGPFALSAGGPQPEAA